MASRFAGFLKGGAPLGVVFWLFGVAGCFAIGSALVLISRVAVESLRTRTGFTLFAVLLGLAVVYLVVVLIATWNSASRYRGRRAFAWLARLTVIGVIAGAALQLARDLPDDIDADELRNMAEQINATLPAAIDQDTRLEHVVAEGRRLIYEYRFINTYAGELDRAVVEKNLRDAMNQTACVNTEMTELLEGGVTVALRYSGKDGGHIATVDIRPQDCGF